MKNYNIILIGFLWLIIITLPYVLAPKLAGDAYEFGGFLFNPIDGYSYLAKMNQGASGAWSFTLPYTPNHTNGAFLFGFYLLLGHVSNWLGIPLVIMYHVARVLSAALFFAVLLFFLRRKCHISDDTLFPTLLLICFGSGMGWLLLASQITTSDFLVAEAYPFLSAFSTPHFILGMAIFLFLLTLVDRSSIRDLAVMWICGLVLSIVMPFGAVIVGILFAVRALQRWIDNRKVVFLPSAMILLGGGISILFQYRQTLRDPLLAGWNAQNVTLTAPVWDILIAFSPAILLAAAGVLIRLREKTFQDTHKDLAAWVVVILALAFLPFSLQRRFLFALFIPVAILAVDGLFLVLRRNSQKFRLWVPVVFTVSIITNLLITISFLALVRNHDPNLVITKDESEAFAWLRHNAAANDIVLASPLTGNKIPAYTHQKVIYGHPFETVESVLASQQIDDFFGDKYPEDRQLEFLADSGIDWIFFGPQEKELGTPQVIQGMQAVFFNETVSIFRPGEGAD